MSFEGKLRGIDRIKASKRKRRRTTKAVKRTKQPKRPATKKKRKLTPYQKFVKKYLREHKGEAPVSQLMKDAARAWRVEKSPYKEALEERVAIEKAFARPVQRVTRPRRRIEEEEFSYGYPLFYSKRAGLSDIPSMLENAGDKVRSGVINVLDTVIRDGGFLDQRGIKRRLIRAVRKAKLRR